MTKVTLTITMMMSAEDVAEFREGALQHLFGADQNSSLEDLLRLDFESGLDEETAERATIDVKVADTPEEALERVQRGEGDEIDFFYNETVGFDEPKEHVPSREKTLDQIREILTDIAVYGDWKHFRYVFGEDAVWDEMIPEGLPDDKLRSIYERHLSYYTKED